MIAHQRLVKNSRAAHAASEDLFGAWWDAVDTDIRAGVIKPIDYATARAIILDYEWLGTMPAVVWHTFGIFWGGHCGGAVVYGPEYGENLGVWDRYGYTGKIICLSRGACTHWAHPHAASRLIRRSMDLLPSRYEVVTATVDARAGEIGTIYQACGFHYVGVLESHGARNCLEVRVASGAPMGDRQARQAFGTRSVQALEARGYAVTVAPSKARYFAFRGTIKQRKAHLRAIQSRLLPYPKRAAQ